MCLLKVYVEGIREGRTLIASNVIQVLVDEKALKILDMEGKEKIISGASLLMIDALNSTLVLKAEEGLEVKG